MHTLTVKRKKFLPFLQNSRNRMMFRLIHIYLIIGSGSLVVTPFYLLGHLNILDKIIYYCIPGFVLGISSGVFYFIGYQSMRSDKQVGKHRYQLTKKTSNKYSV